MSIRVEVYGDSLIDVADELLDEMVEPAKAAVKDARDLVFDEARRLLSLRSSGPSIEGAPPVQRSGELLRSLRKTSISVHGRVVSAGFQTKHPGAMRLEWGFVDERGIRTLPHPWLRPAFSNTYDAVEKRLSDLGDANVIRPRQGPRDERGQFFRNR